MDLSRNDLSLIATTIKTLAIDAVQQANSGHPGMPMGCADIAAVLWGKILRYNPDDPAWFNRDRFVLSAGHGSMLLYAALHLSGYPITLDDLRNFRQWGSITPGHPEQTVTPGVETSTGPLGQGFANGVGMAYAARMLARKFDTGAKLLDHYIYAIVGDGDLMEGISYEAASMAGHLGLGNIIYIYDSNDISIEGNINCTYSDDVRARFESCHWHVQVIDGHDHDAIESALLAAQAEKERPSLIVARTRIAKGSPGKEGSASAHGSPLGADEILATKRSLGCSDTGAFCVPDRVYQLFAERKNELRRVYDESMRLFAATLAGEQRREWDAWFSRPDIPALRAAIPRFEEGTSIATRSASGKVLEKLFPLLPNFVGGSADLGPSNMSFVKGFDETGKGTLGRNIHFGVREHAMAAFQNGIAYYGGLIPYSSTFFVFMDYLRPAVRVAALAHLPVIYVLTHDSFHVGEDGPTHQPVEHLASARAIPNLTVIRPADAEETREGWLAALANKKGPTMLVLSRQNLTVIARDARSAAENLHRGAYVIRECAGEPSLVMLATGSEVQLALEAADQLEAKNVRVRVVSFPSWELFDAQPEEYRQAILCHGTPKVVLEAGIRMGWERYAGNHALYITKEGFGISAPAKVLTEKFGFTKESVVARALDFLASKKK